MSNSDIIQFLLKTKWGKMFVQTSQHDLNASTYITNTFTYPDGREGVLKAILLLRYDMLRNNQHYWITLPLTRWSHPDLLWNRTFRVYVERLERFFSRLFFLKNTNRSRAAISRAVSGAISCSPPQWPRCAQSARQECFRLWLCWVWNTVTEEMAGSDRLGCRNPYL